MRRRLTDALLWLRRCPLLARPAAPLRLQDGKGGKRELEGGESAQPPAKRRKRVSFADGAALQQVRILPALTAAGA